MTDREITKELRELRKLLADLHKDARGNGHGQCFCERTGPVCALHTQVRIHILTAEQNLREAVILLNESAMSRTT